MHGAIPIAPCLAAQRRGSSEKNRPGPLDPSCVGLLRLVNQSMGPDDNIDAIDRFPQQIRDAHRASINHRAQIECSDRCGCFHCGALFQPKEIEHWVDEGPDGRGTTAMCPRCDIDSVLGDQSGFPISAEFLDEMHRYWFTDEFSPEA
jgi:hypothetical protein